LCVNLVAVNQRRHIAIEPERLADISPGRFQLNPRTSLSLAPGEVAFVLCRGAALHGSPAFQGRDNNTNNRFCRGATIDARASAIQQEIIHASLRDAVDVGCIVSEG
jgi:hypothetical protein